jgi:glyoxylate reductase
MGETVRVATTVTLPGDLAERIRGAGAVLEEVVAADAIGPALSALIVTITDRVNESVLNRLQKAGATLVANIGAGTNNIDVAAAVARGIDVTNTPDVLTDATADIAMGLILDVTRRISEGDRLVRSGADWAWAFDFMWGQSLSGKRLGIIGYGRIGEALATRARAFGMEILASSRRPRAEKGVRWVSQDELFREADVVSLHCPLTADTRHLVDAGRLREMKPTAVLINTARGPVVDETALVAALRDGVIAGAGLDVYEDEPSLADGLTDLSNVTLAPHLGSATRETRESMAALAVDNVLARLRGEELVTRVGAS